MAIGLELKNQSLMIEQRKQDPLHGVTLKAILTDLVEKHGWEELGKRVRINCFSNNPSFNSSLKFLRKTPWARQKVENLYLRDKATGSK